DDMWSAFPGVCADGSYIPLWQCGGDIVRGPVHFTQLYGVFIGVAVLLITLWALNRTSKLGFAFWQMVLWYSVLRSVFEETFRDNPLMWNVSLADGLDQPGIGLFTVTQVASVAIIAVAVWMLARVRAQPEAPAVAAGGPGPRGGATAPAPARRRADGSGRAGADGGAKRKAGGKGEGRGWRRGPRPRGRPSPWWCWRRGRGSVCARRCPRCCTRRPGGRCSSTCCAPPRRWRPSAPWWWWASPGTRCASASRAAATRS